jgi:uncharacterized protein
MRGHEARAGRGALVEELDRRSLFKGGLGLAAGLALGGPAQAVLGGAAGASPGGARPAGWFDLVVGPDLRDGVNRLALPRGFEYRSFHDSSTGVLLSDGTTPVPGRHDGMGAFPGPDGKVVLVRNHEVNGPGARFSTSAPFYDERARGGTTTTTVDVQGNVADAFASLAGTQMNCSGGAMPWGSWITCEETVNGPDVFDDFTRGSAPPTTYVNNVLLKKPHGFIFEVPVGGGATAAPITAAGRFAHEAVAYDPRAGVLYLTEDDFGFPSGFYRYTPPVHPRDAGRIEDGGLLEMLAVPDRPNIDLSARHDRRRVHYQVAWVPIGDPAPTFTMDGTVPTTINDDALHYVAGQGWAQGAAYFSRLEGCVYNRWDRRVYFSSTQGGGDPETDPVTTPRGTGYGKGSGQIWSYDPRSEKLRLEFEAPNRDVLDFPDNLAVGPFGHVVICEDNVAFNYIRVLTHFGGLVDVARNEIPGRTDDEFAGACFSPDGLTLFVNIQASNGLTFAIWGPWRRSGLM